MTSHKKMITNIRSFSFGFYKNYNIWSFLKNTSHFEIGAWNFWYFHIESEPSAFWAPYISNKKSLSLFLSQILVCATAFMIHNLFFILRFTFGELYCKNIKNKCGKIYRHKSMQVSRPSRLLTNHSWQAWRSIYNNHT